jgi:hypothetical protein
MVALAAQPAEKSALQQVEIEPVGLGAAVLARDRYAGRVDDMRFEAARLQPTGQPEAS